MPNRSLLAGAAVALFASLMLGIGIGGYALYEPDEARHANIAREMLDASSWRDWVTPKVDGVPYRNKPAPFYWSVAAAMAALGVRESAARLVSVVAGVLTAVAASLWAAGRWGPRTGALTGLVLLTAPEYFLLGRFVTADMSLTLWVTLGVLAVHRFARLPGASLVPAALAGACGLLAKGVVAPGVIAAVGLAYLALTGRLRLLTARTLALAGLAFLCVALPWHVAAGVLDPTYLRTLFVEQQWRRAVDAGGGRMHDRSILFYVPVLLGGFFPWSALLPATIHGALRRERRDDAAVFCALWAATVLVLFSMARGKVGTYVLPAFPPLALLTARYLGLLLAGVASGLELRLTRLGLWIVVAVLALAPVAAITAAAREYDGVLLGVALWSLLLPVVAVGLALLLRRARLPHTALAVGGMAGAILLLVALFVAPPLMELHSDVAIARVLRAAGVDRDDGPLVAYHVQSASLRFYLHRPIVLRETPGQLRRLLSEHPTIYLVTSRRHVPELAQAGSFIPWYVGPRRVLYATHPPPAPAGPAP